MNDHNCDEIFNYILGKLNKKKDDLKSPLIDNIQSLYKGVSEIRSLARDYNYKNINANGYWTFVKSSTKFVLLVDKHVHNEKLLKHLEILSYGYLKFLRHLLSVHQIASKSHSSLYLSLPNFINSYEENINKSLFIPPSIDAMNVLLDGRNVSTELTALFSSFGVFWLERSFQHIFDVYITLVALFGASFPLSLKGLWNRKHRVDIFTKWIQFPTSDYPFRLWDVVDYKIIRTFLRSTISFNYTLKAKTVYIPSQNRILVSKDGNHCIFNNNNDNISHPIKKSIRCRFLKSSESNKYLLFHCHGGGFITHSPDCHELYLRNWIKKIPNMTILSVDYSLNTRFPVPIQEVLDTYLWIISGSPEVKRMLGFQPTSIVFCGDSAGANLIISLLIILNDLKRLNNFRVLMPIGVVSIYGSFMMSPLVCPSRIMGAIDPLVSPGVLLICGNTYGGFETKEAQYDGTVSSILEVENMFHNIEIYNKVIMKTCKPYMSPLTYKAFDTLLDVKLVLITTEFCPLLDETITMAKLWKGPLHLDVLSDLPHGFLNFTIVSKRGRKASNLCIQRIKEIFF